MTPTAAHVGVRGLARLEETFGPAPSLLVDELVYVWAAFLCNDLTAGPFPRLGPTVWWLCHAVFDADLGAGPYGSLSPEGALFASEAGVDLVRDFWGMRSPEGAPPGWHLWLDRAAGLYRFARSPFVPASDLDRLYDRASSILVKDSDSESS